MPPRPLVHSPTAPQARAGGLRAAGAAVRRPLPLGAAGPGGAVHARGALPRCVSCLHSAAGLALRWAAGCNPSACPSSNRPPGMPAPAAEAKAELLHFCQSPFPSSSWPSFAAGAAAATGLPPSIALTPTGAVVSGSALHLCSSSPAFAKWRHLLACPQRRRRCQRAAAARACRWLLAGRACKISSCATACCRCVQLGTQLGSCCSLLPVGRAA